MRKISPYKPFLLDDTHVHFLSTWCSFTLLITLFTVLCDPNLKRAEVDGVNGILWLYVRYMGVGRFLN